MKYSEAFEEFVADSMEKMLTDQNAVEKLAILRTKDKSVFDKLREGIQKLVDRIKQEYAKFTPDSAEGRTVATMTDVFSDIQDLFLEALDDASNNFKKAEKNTIIDGGVKMQARSKYARQGGMFSNALTGAEWTKYNHAMTTGMDAGLRISDHSMLVECENGYYSYKLVVYDNTIEEKPIKSIYGIGQNLYNKDITSFDAKIIGEFITELEDIDYDNKKTFERILKHYSRNVGYILGRYNSKSGRFNRYGREIFENEKSTRQETDRNGVSQRTGKSVKFSLRENVEETEDLVAVHNLSAEKLLKSLNLGGLPMPSIAIMKAKDGHNQFGDISLVFRKDTIDPEADKSNKVYSGDAWTPTYPRTEYKVNEDVASKIYHRARSAGKHNGTVSVKVHHI